MMPQESALLAVDHLRMHFPLSTGGIFHRQKLAVRAVDDVSFSIAPGETLSLVGESGCGKTTTGRCVLKMYPPTSGSVRFEGLDLVGIDGAAMKAIRRQMQMVFQDPYGCLNPRMNAEQIISEPMVVHNVGSRRERRERVIELLGAVGLHPHMRLRYPHEFSGGQRQRLAIARAVALKPRLIVCDEAVSALDVSVQAQIVNLLQDLQEQFGLTYLFISHDLAVVRHISDRVAVMYLGKIVEMGRASDIYRNPLHPYTKALLSAVPVAKPTVEAGRQRILLRGDVPSPVNPPPGCRFHTRCWLAFDQCREVEPELRDVETAHVVACHLR